MTQNDPCLCVCDNVKSFMSSVLLQVEPAALAVQAAMVLRAQLEQPVAQVPPVVQVRRVLQVIKGRMDCKVQLVSREELEASDQRAGLVT